VSHHCHFGVATKIGEIDPVSVYNVFMGKEFTVRALCAAFVLAGSVMAMPAKAERLVFDHRLYPALKEVLDRDDPSVIAYDASNPRYVVDLIMIKGKSTTNWSEALEIIARTPAKKVSSEQDWKAEIENRIDRGCRSVENPVGDDPAATMFERVYADCPGIPSRLTMTRIIKGKRSLFLLSFKTKSLPDEATRRQWIALLQSAHIE